MTDRLTLIRPDDWHIHLRDGAVLQHTVPDAARAFGRAIIMPNLVPPVRDAEEAAGYRERILAARPAGSRFEPLMVRCQNDQRDSCHTVLRLPPPESRGACFYCLCHRHVREKLYPANQKNAGGQLNRNSGSARRTHSD